MPRTESEALVMYQAQDHNNLPFRVPGYDGRIRRDHTTGFRCPRPHATRMIGFHPTCQRIGYFLIHELYCQACFFHRGTATRFSSIPKDSGEVEPICVSTPGSLHSLKASELLASQLTCTLSQDLYLLTTHRRRYQFRLSRKE